MNSEELTRDRLNCLDVKLDRILDALETVTLRLGSLEQKTAIVVTDIARIDARLDGFDRRLDRIEKRLDLTGHPVSSEISASGLSVEDHIP